MNVVGTRKWWALGGITLAVLAVGLDGTVLSVALPTLATALHASESDLQWFTSGYLLVLAAAMLPAGLLGDRFGRKKVMAVSLVFFGIGSAACAFSTSAGEFIAARVLLGLAGAGIVVMALAAVTVLFTEEERPRAVGIWSGANFLALPIGPILGGWLLTNYWWGWVFLMNVPVALIGLVATLALVPESRAPRRPGAGSGGDRFLDCRPGRRRLRSYRSRTERLDGGVFCSSPGSGSPDPAGILSLGATAQPDPGWRAAGGSWSV